MPTAKIRENKRSNLLQTVFLITAMGGLLALTGFMLMGWVGMIAAMGVLLFGILFTKRASAAMVLKMYKAKPIQYHQAPQLMDLFKELCDRAKLDSEPGLFYIPSRLPNAFACGVPGKESVAITDGLLRMLNPRELSGVLAHEVAHIMNDDLRVLGTADTISRTISMLSRFGMMLMLFSFSGTLIGAEPFRMIAAGLLLFFAPTIVVLLQLAVSRTREFNADQGAAELTGDPQGLSSALQKLERLTGNNTGILERILKPGQKRAQPAMLRTHPPTQERVDKLNELVKEIANPEQNGSLKSSQHRMPILIQPKIKRRPKYHWVSGLWH